MLTRKQSLRGDVPLADYGPDENLNDNTDIEWVNKQLVNIIIILSKIPFRFYKNEGLINNWQTS